MSTRRPRADAIDGILTTVLDEFPPLSAAGRIVGMALHELLLGGQPVRREELAAVVHLPTREVEAILDEPGMRTERVYDERRRIVGFGGLSVDPTDHVLTLSTGTVYTWCAWDALFLPDLLRRAATLDTSCPSTGESIHMAITSTGPEPAEGTVVLTFPVPESRRCAQSAERLINRFCALVRLCSSAAAARRWVSYRDDMHLLELRDAFELGRRYHRRRYPHGKEPRP